MANRDKRLNLDQTLANLSDERVGLLRLEWIARQGLAERYFPPLWTSLLSRGPSHQSLAAKPTQLTLQTTHSSNHSQKCFNFFQLTLQTNNTTNYSQKCLKNV